MQFPAGEPHIPDGDLNRRATTVQQSKREAELAAEVRAAREFIDKMLTSLNDHYVIFDNEWRYIYANDAAARTLGFPKENLIGNVIWELFPNAVGNQFYQELHLARDTRQDFVSEHYYSPTDKWFENHFYALPDGVAVLSIDITARKRAEESQRQSEQMLAFALQSVNMVAWEWDIDGGVVKFSRADNHIYGKEAIYSSKESYQTVYPDDLPEHRAKVNHCISTGMPYHSSYRIIRPDNGEINWVEEWGFAVRNDEGVIKKLFGVAMENTERKETEQRLQVIYQLSEAVNRASAVEQIYELALSGLERVLHVRRASILLIDHRGVMRFQAWRGLSEQYRLLTDGQLPRFINDANPVPVLITDVEEELNGAQKQVHLDEGIHAIAFIPLIEGQRLIGKFMLYYDPPHQFTEAEVQWAETIARHVAHALARKQAETRLQTYAQTLESLNHIQLSLAAELDLHRLLQMVTDVSTELSGAQFGAFFYNALEQNGEGKGNDQDGQLMHTLSSALQEYFTNAPVPYARDIFGATFGHEGIIRVADAAQDERFGQEASFFGLPPGHIPIVSYLVVPVISRAGEVIGGLFMGHSKRGVFTDQVEQLLSGIASQAAIMIENARLYTQLKASETALRELNATLEQRVEQRTAELERSNRELDQFAYVASHDLKAPLRAINHLASWIAQDVGESLPLASQEHLQKLQARVRRMETLLNDLLAYSRAARQRHPVEVVDINDIIADATEFVAPPAGFAVRIDRKLPILRTERTPLEIIFRNLIGNAIKHHDNPAAGVVEISARDRGEFVEFVVKDNGPGIEPVYHQRIFEMFQTLKPRDLVEGSGVGLAVVKRTVESRGGSIQVVSDVGEGAAFCFTWPKVIAL
jgi:PAS domain S-box-containing protein